MGEIYLNCHKIVDELVGIVGMLNNRRGSTLKDIMGVLESLHGPMRRDIIQDGLKAGISSGVIEIINRRYKVRKHEAVFERNNVPAIAGCSSWEFGIPKDTDSIEDIDSISSPSTQLDQDLADEISCPPSGSCSIKEILSVQSMQSSNSSVFTYPYSCRSEESLKGNDLKGKKRKEKRPLVVKLPIYKKKSTIENDSENSPILIDDNDQEIKEHVETPKCDQVLMEDKQTQNCFENVPQDDVCLTKSSNSILPAKRSINDIMTRVMKQFSVQDEIVNDNHEKVVSCNKEESKTFDMSNIMTIVMKNVNASEQSNSIPEMSSKGEEEVGGVDPVVYLGGVITNVMKKITGKEEQEHSLCYSSNKSNESPSNAVESTSKSNSRCVGTDPQDVLPSSSKNKPSKLAKKEKKGKQDYDNNDNVNRYKYLTRSRAKAGELKRSCLQSSSDSSTSLKRGKLSEA